jgi:hypothetical protein
MRMRGLEPPPGFPDTDLNRARLPIPPHPRGEAKISQTRAASFERDVDRTERTARSRLTRRGRFASLGAVVLRRYRPGD